MEISNQFGVSLDTLLKEDTKMVQAIDRQRTAGVIKREIKRIDMLTGAGTGIVASCLLSPQSAIRTVMILTGIIMICVGWYQKAEHDQKMLRYIEKSE